jgi:hypothetical protein
MMFTMARILLKFWVWLARELLGAIRTSRSNPLEVSCNR